MEDEPNPTDHGHDGPRVSRAPVVVTLAGLALAGVLVLIGARLAATPVVVTLAGLALAGVLVLIGARLAATPVDAPPVTSPGTAARPRPVNVIMREYTFNPSTLRLVAGETVRLTVFNAGLVDHEFVLGNADVQRAWAEANARATPPAPFASPPRASAAPMATGVELVLRPGESATVDYVAPVAGELQLICHLAGHAERGMVAAVSIDPR